MSCQLFFLVLLFSGTSARLALVSQSYFNDEADGLSRPKSDSTILLASVSSTSPNGYTTGLYSILISTRGVGGRNAEPLPKGAITFSLGSADECPRAAGPFDFSTVVVPDIDKVSPNSIKLKINKDWISVKQELETFDRILCWSYPGQIAPVTTGFWVRVMFNCVADNAPLTADALKCGNWGAQQWALNKEYDAVRASASPITVAMQMAKTTCCRGTVAIISGDNGSPVITAGQCVNPNEHTCCGSTQASVGVEKCCNAAAEATRFTDPALPTQSTVCPCSIGSGPTACPSGESCCVKRKYKELDPVALSASGECFNPKSKRCCDTGAQYDPATQQCCSISGVSSFAEPCPCSADEHCAGGDRDANGNPNAIKGRICCKQTAPALTQKETCSTYINYPSGQSAAAQGQMCFGSCIDPTYQICCNGKSCIRETDKCCNTSCCNKFSRTCIQGRYSAYFNDNADKWQSDFTTPTELNVKYDLCTEVESLDTIKAYWIFVLPTVLLLATFTALALVLVFANNTSALRYDFIERAMIGVAVLVILLGLPLYFAPVYKYGVVVVFVGLFSIITAAARVKWLNITTLLLLIVTLIYLIDPFHANAFINLASGRYGGVYGGSSGDVYGRTDPNTAGVLHATNALWRELNVIAGGRSAHRLTGTPGFIETTEDNEATLTAGNFKSGVTRCTQFYNYFTLDDGQLSDGTNLQGLRDLSRLDNPEVTTFGYCSRAWITALLLFEGGLVVAVLILFVLALVGLIVRFRADRSYDPIELEVHQGGEFIYQQ